MNRFLTRFTRFSCQFINILFCLFAGLGLVLSLTTLSLPGLPGISSHQGWGLLLLLSGLFFCLLFFLTLTRKIRRMALSPAKTVTLTVICALLILAGQIFYIASMNTTLVFDALTVLDEGIGFARTHSISLWSYFGKYSNQRFFLYFTGALYTLADKLSIPSTQHYLYIHVWCVIFLDTALFLCGFLIYRLRGAKALLLFMVFLLLSPFTYIWTTFYYTTTVCLPFMIAGPCLIVLYAGTSRRWQRFLLVAVFIPISFVGFMLRPTVYIVLLAMVIVMVLAAGSGLSSDTASGKGWLTFFCKKNLGCLMALAAILGGFLLLSQAYARFDSAFLTVDTDAYELPPLHWIAMGAKDSGLYDLTDEANMLALPTYAARKEAAADLLTERLGNLGPVGLAELALNKTRVVWADGSDGYQFESVDGLRYGTLYRLLVGDHCDFFVYLCQVLRCATFLLLLAGGVLSLRKKTPDLFLLFRLCLVGGFLFYLIWEAKELYSIAFMPFVFLLAIDSLLSVDSLLAIDSKLEQYSSPEHNARTVVSVSIVSVSIAACLLTIGAAITFYPELTQKVQSQNDYIVSQTMSKCDTKAGLTAGNSICQEFYANKPFNTAGARIRETTWYYGIPNESSYRMTITDSKGTVVAEQTLSGDDYEDLSYCDVTFPAVTPPKGGETYRLTYEALETDDSSYLVFLKRISGNLDCYPDGTYMENGAFVSADLTFYVTYAYQAPYVPASLYLVAVILTCCLESGVALWALFKLIKKRK